ncbi:MAG: DEAD/DEAH box helicase [Bdellovibrionaceae bacterium]|nr:DEAD/DEAH box helicase [Pseudobdellovibrionaceae bacterium]
MKSFSDFQFPMPVQQTLQKLNFTTTTEIQNEALPYAFGEQDLVACAQTGSGKTLAYSLPLLTKLFESPEKGGLILAPSRELAQQIAGVIRPFVENTRNLKMSVIVGGTDMIRQVRSLKRNPHIIVATPGRLNDHLRRRTVNLKNFEYLILDEGDRMLDMGFAPQLEEIFKYLPEKRYTMLFTATLPSKVKALIKDYLYQPKEIIIGPRSQPVSQIKQKVIFAKKQNKESLLMDELNRREGSVIIFSKTKVKTDKLADQLNEYGFNALKIHGDRTQGQRNRAIENFKNNKSRILCATDVVARGLDIPQVRHVINFDLPMMDEDFVHRVGRTGRNGASGDALSFVTPAEVSQWRKIAKRYKLSEVETEEHFAQSQEDQSSGYDSRSRNSRPSRNRKSVRTHAKRQGDSSERRADRRGQQEGRSEGKTSGSRSKKKSSQRNAKSAASAGKSGFKGKKSKSTKRPSNKGSKRFRGKKR